MKRLRAMYRRLVLAVMAVLPGRTVPQAKAADPDDQVRQRDERLAVATRKTRMWTGLFPGLTEAQRRDPTVLAVLPWNGRGQAAQMAKLTEDQWNPAVIQAKKQGDRAPRG